MKAVLIHQNGYDESDVIDQNMAEECEGCGLREALKKIK